VAAEVRTTAHHYPHFGEVPGADGPYKALLRAFRKETGHSPECPWPPPADTHPAIRSRRQPPQKRPWTIFNSTARDSDRAHYSAADRASGGTRHGAFRAVRTHARHGPHQLRDDLSRFTFLLGGSHGELLFGP
jgi:hypothetical protein